MAFESGGRRRSFLPHMAGAFGSESGAVATPSIGRRKRLDNATAKTQVARQRNPSSIEEFGTQDRRK